MPGLRNLSEEEIRARQELRRIVGINPETVSNVSSTEYPGNYPYEQLAWDLGKFRDNFKVQFHKLDPYTYEHQTLHLPDGTTRPKNFDAEFSLIGLDASIANAFRRIMIAEVPTIAIENVFMFNNTSIIQDEVLGHRLGLIPLAGARKGFHNMHWPPKRNPDDPTADADGGQTDYNTVQLELHVECTWKQDGMRLARSGETDPEKLYNNSNVYARDLQWNPEGQQAEWFTEENGGAVKPVNPDILIAKLRPGQTISCSLFCVKGQGSDHTKFSPVCTASYRLLPDIKITKPIIGKDAQKFARCFPRGVIRLEPATREEAEEGGGKQGDVKAVVADPMKDTVSRECLRHEEFKNKVKLGRVRDHFIFRVESTGQFESDDLFLESVKLLKGKCVHVKKALADMTRL